MFLLSLFAPIVAVDWWMEPNEQWSCKVWYSSNISNSCCKTDDGGVPLDLTLKEMGVFWEPGGFFIESGGQDGLFQSNTLAAEKKFGWKGLLIEPSRAKSLQCKKYREPPSLCLHAALTEFGGPHDIGLSNDGAPTAQMTSSGNIPAHPLSAILHRHNIHKIDFWSLDIEGYEMKALNGVNFTVHRPTWILIEVWKEDPQIFAKMNTEGYCLQPGINGKKDISGWNHYTPHRDYLWKDCKK